METITISSIRKVTDSDFTDLLTVINYDLTITRDTEVASGSFQCTLGYPNVGEPGYVEYSSLTENTVKTWVEGSPEYPSSVYTLEKTIEERVAENITSFPWS